MGDRTCGSEFVVCLRVFQHFGVVLRTGMFRDIQNGWRLRLRSRSPDCRSGALFSEGLDLVQEQRERVLPVRNVAIASAGRAVHNSIHRSLGGDLVYLGVARRCQDR